MVKNTSLVEDWNQIEAEILQVSSFVDNLLLCLKRTIIGQENLLEKLLIGLFGNGHILLEGLPGLAKTLAVKSLAEAIQAQFSRIQFTPDLLPVDILGTMIYDQQKQEFKVRKGPIFSNFILADEINRAPEKVQSALLEAMQEQQVTIGDTTYKLDSPFLVMATQNPVEQNGTYELPEAQLDRFMLKVNVTYPALEEEKLIIRQNLVDKTTFINPIFDITNVLEVQNAVKKIFIDDKIEKYILDIVFSTRFPGKYNLKHLESFIRFGASPRGSINLALASRVYAFLQKRSFVIPEDVAAVTLEVLRHRIGITYVAKADNINADAIIKEILETLPSP